MQYLCLTSTVSIFNREITYNLRVNELKMYYISFVCEGMCYLAIVYSTVYSGVDQRNHQRSASLAFVWGIHR